MKYEFKPFSYPSYLLDLADGWNMTFQVHEEYPDGTPRDVEIVDLGPKAHYKYRLASIDLAEGGAVRMHDIYGRFDPSTSAPCVLDLILYREVPEKPAEVTIHGYALVNDAGEVFCVQPYEIRGGSDGYKPVPCTITLHNEPT